MYWFPIVYKQINWEQAVCISEKLIYSSKIKEMTIKWLYEEV